MSSNQLTIPDFKFRNNLEKHNLVFGLIQQVSAHIKEIPNFDKLRVELELIKLVCRIVENIVKRGNPKKVDKKQLVIDALSNVFNLTPGEKTIVESLIDFLWNNKLIKRSSYTKLVKNYVLSYIKTK